MVRFGLARLCQRPDKTGFQFFNSVEALSASHYFSHVAND